MTRNGFTLVELIVVMAIIGILLAVGTMEFHRYTLQAGIEGQVRTMYADLMKARSEAIMQKVDRYFNVDVTSGRIAIATTVNVFVAPLVQWSFKYPVATDFSDVIYFDTRGVADGTKTICVGTSGNPAAVDSIQVGQTMIVMGKWNGSCDSAHFAAK
jgi:prepilin-type N-terminal cleavage/methylation domain-containing protein